jgi:hypothetical protein
VALALLLAAPGLRADPATESQQLRSAKTLFFDGRYAEARGAWEAVRAAGGPDAEAAGYWVARCSESLGEPSRALSEYGQFLDQPPRNRALAEEARTARVSLAAKLYRQGQKQHLPVLTEALKSESASVRTFAALQLAGLGAPVGKPAVPVLCALLAGEKDPELVDRAKLALLKVDPQALAGERCSAPSASPRPAAGQAPAATWIRVRIYEAGQSKPNVAINLPLALGDLVFKSLPEDSRRELRKKGIDADTFWERLRRLGPTELIQIQGDDGERIEIRTE